MTGWSDGPGQAIAKHENFGSSQGSGRLFSQLFSAKSSESTENPWSGIFTSSSDAAKGESALAELYKGLGLSEDLGKNGLDSVKDLMNNPDVRVAYRGMGFTPVQIEELSTMSPEQIMGGGLPEGSLDKAAENAQAMTDAFFGAS